MRWTPRPPIHELQQARLFRRVAIIGAVALVLGQVVSGVVGETLILLAVSCIMTAFVFGWIAGSMGGHPRSPAREPERFDASTFRAEREIRPHWDAE